MRNRCKSMFFIMLLAISAALALDGLPALADMTRTQTIDLVAGWNAVFLEVEPVETDLDAAFEDTPIVQAASFFPKYSSMAFVQDPGEDLWKKAGWHRWAPPGHPAAVLNNLYRLQANRAYLLYSASDFAWEVEGTPVLRRVEWEPDAFNMLGFHVDETAPPTFAQFFEGSRAHQDLQIYQLVNNQWLQITEPSGVNIASGRAYWVYCDGGSDHQGPLEIALPAGGASLNFFGPLVEMDIQVVNGSPNPLSFTIKAAAGNQVPLSLVQNDPAAETVTSYEAFTEYASETALEAGDKQQVRLAARRKEIMGGPVFGMLKIADDLGNRFFVAVRAEKL